MSEKSASTNDLIEVEEPKENEPTSVEETSVEDEGSQEEAKESAEETEAEDKDLADQVKTLKAASRKWENRAKENRLEIDRLNAVIEHGLSKDDLSFITGSTTDEIQSNAKRLAERLGTAAKASKVPMRTQAIATDGPRKALSIREQIEADLRAAAK